MIRSVVICFLLVCGLQSAWAESRHVLKGRIIRSLAVEAQNPDHILAGQKAGKPGAALVFQSKDGGKGWRTLNGNTPLAAKATDVQAVAALNAEVLIAGTWKHGLYISRDGGRHFERHRNFPSRDIRDLQILGNKIYAATAGHGVYESTDAGQSWRAIGPDKNFFWSLSVTGDTLYAVSLERAVYARSDGEWTKIFADDNAYALAAVKDLIAIAGESGLYLQRGKGWRKALAGEKLADVVFINDHALTASWTNGVVVISRDGKELKRLLPGLPVVHLQIAGDKLLAGTWGQGLHILPLALPMAEIAAQIPLIAATMKGDDTQVRCLLADGANPDEFDDNRNTALILAARAGRTEIASMLLEAGADPGWIDAELVTPLILASFKNHIEIVRLLLARNVSRDHRDQWGRTALDYAKRRGTADPVYQLLKKEE